MSIVKIKKCTCGGREKISIMILNLMRIGFGAVIGLGMFGAERTRRNRKTGKEMA